MLEATYGLAHWTRVFFWSAVAAVAFPLGWLVADDLGQTALDPVPYPQLFGPQLPQLVLLVAGCMFAIHEGLIQTRPGRRANAVAFAVMIAWVSVTLAVALLVFGSEGGGQALLGVLVASPLFVVVGLPGFLVVALGVLIEQRRLGLRPPERKAPRPRPLAKT